MKLSELVAFSNRVEELLAANDGEITEDIELLLALKEAALPDKVESYAHIIEKLRHQAQYYAKRANQFIKISEACDKIADNCIDRVDHAMNELKVEELPGHDFKFKKVNNPVSVVIVDENLVPEKFKDIKTTYSIRKTDVKAALTKGEEVPGCELKQGYRIKIGVNK